MDEDVAEHNFGVVGVSELDDAPAGGVDLLEGVARCEPELERANAEVVASSNKVEKNR